MAVTSSQPSSSRRSSSKSKKNALTSPTERFIGRRAADRATEKVKEVFPPSCPLMKRASHRISNCAVFSADEIRKGRKLGTGGFSCVYEIESFRLLEEDASPSREAARRHLAKTARVENPYAIFYGDDLDMANYAIKHLKPSLIDSPNEFITGAADLSVEARMMLALDHPNILKVRGFSSAGAEGFYDSPDGYFLIVDRLCLTLEQKLMQWRMQLNKYQNMKNFLLRGKKARKLQALLSNRLQVAHDIASAMDYLHKQHILFRDLKSANIGMDQSGSPKIFDFGLARRMESDWDYQETPLKKVGSKYYMAPEVTKSEPYNSSADVYSFGVVLWEIMACQSCLDRENRDMPLPISADWPPALQDLVRRTLSTDLNDRPTMSQVKSILRQQLCSSTKSDEATPSLEYSSGSEESSG